MARMSPLRSLFEPVREWICRSVCGQRFFDRDASLLNDRLIIEVERLQEGLDAANARLADWEAAP
jgi:hypothetical protein